jgi:hypothetical protein
VTIREALINLCPEARFVFRNKWQQQELDRLCEHAAPRAAVQKNGVPAA